MRSLLGSLYLTDAQVSALLLQKRDAIFIAKYTLIYMYLVCIFNKSDFFIL